MSITVNVERGDQTLEQLSILVDGKVADSPSFGSSMGTAPPEEEPAEQAIHAFTLSFDSGEYDGDGTASYMTGTAVITKSMASGPPYHLFPVFGFNAEFPRASATM